MAGTKGTNQFFELDDSGGSPVVLTTTEQITEISPSFDPGLEDTTSIGDTGHTFTVTISNGSITLTVIWTASAEAHFAGLFGLALTSTFNYGANGNTGGNRKITGECRLGSWNVGAGAGGVNMISATLQIDGAITFTTF